MMIKIILRIVFMVCAMALSSQSVVAAPPPVYSFGVVPLRSAVLTAEFWNPILDFVSKEAGVRLELRIDRSVHESALALERGEHDFAYSYLMFRPKALVQGYQVIARPKNGEIRSQIVVLADSPIQKLEELAGRAIAFPSRSGFVAYALPMDHLLRQGVQVKAEFSGNQEGALAQLKVGRVAAASATSHLIRAYAAREGLSYRVLWESVAFHDLPIAAHPRVNQDVVKRVQSAFVSMAVNPEGQKTQEKAARSIVQKSLPVFVKSTTTDYQMFSEFYQETLVKDLE